VNYTVINLLTYYNWEITVPQTVECGEVKLKFENSFWLIDLITLGWTTERVGGSLMYFW